MATLQGPAQTFGGGVSDAHTTPFPHAVGTRARDSAGNEYVYVDFTAGVAPEMVVVISPTFTAAPLTTTNWGPAVGIVPDYTKLGGSVTGIVTMDTSYKWTSDNAGWVQIYGRGYVMVLGGSLEISDAANAPTTAHTSAAMTFTPPTTVTTPVGTVLMTTGNAIVPTSGYIQIVGMFLATDVTIADVSTGLSVAGVSSTPATAASDFASWHTGNRIPVWLNYPYLKVSSAYRTSGA